MEPITVGRRSPTSKPRPNVLLLIIDDLRPDLGAYGRPWAQTPHLDRLAQRGSTMMHAYASVANCCPSRAALLTGVRPDFSGVLDLYTHVRDRRPSVVTLPQRFRQAGYVTLRFGKVFHHGLDDEPSWSAASELPAGLANRSCRGRDGCGDWTYDQYMRAGSPRPPAGGCASLSERGPEGNPRGVGYTDYVLASHASRALRRLAQHRRPWFMAVGFIRPHLPFNSPAPYYDGAMRRMRATTRRTQSPPRTLPPSGASGLTARSLAEGMTELQGNFKCATLGGGRAQRELLSAAYAAAVSFADAQLGRVLATLEATRLDRSSVVVALGDHGWKLGHLGGWGKHSPMTQDVHVPLIIAPPLPAAAVSSTGALQRLRLRSSQHQPSPPSRAAAVVNVDAPVELIDVYPTLLELAGLRAPPGQRLQGRSLARAMRGAASARWHAEAVAISQWPFGLDWDLPHTPCMGYSVRTANWTLVQWVRTPTRCTRHRCRVGALRGDGDDAAEWAALRAALRSSAGEDPCRKHADLFRAPPPGSHASSDGDDIATAVAAACVVDGDGACVVDGGGDGDGDGGGRGRGRGAWAVEPDAVNVIRSHPEVADRLRRVLARTMQLPLERVGLRREGGRVDGASATTTSRRAKAVKLGKVVATAAAAAAVSYAAHGGSAKAFIGRPSRLSRTIRSTSLTGRTGRTGRTGKGSMPGRRLRQSLLERPPHTNRNTNPVLNVSTPDPAALLTPSEILVVSTGGGNAGRAFPIHRYGRSERRWRFAGWAMSSAAPWWRKRSARDDATQFLREDIGRGIARAHRPGGASTSSWTEDDFWAPEIHRVGGRYLLYYTARDANGSLCVGVAVSNTGRAVGPYTDALGAPLLRRPDGAIDAHVFMLRRGGGAAVPYLLWKDDSNALGRRTTIYMQRLRADGLGLVGSPTPLISNDPRGWEGSLVEGPWLVHDTSSQPPYFFLFYSANAFHSSRYAVGVARSTSPLGPYVKRGPPLLHSPATSSSSSSSSRSSRFLGPGHCSVVRMSDGRGLLMYHAWLRDKRTGGPDERFGRQLMVEQLSFGTGTNRWPSVGKEALASGSSAVPSVAHGQSFSRAWA